MYVRKKQNKSGSTSVQLVKGERVPGKKNSITKTIKSFGFANDEETLKKLCDEAERYKAHLEAANPKAISLKVTSDKDIKKCRSYNIGFNDVYGELFDNVFKNIDLSDIEKDRLKDLAVMRIAEPASKRKTALLGEQYNQDHSVDSFYKLMDQMTPDIIEQIKNTVYKKTHSLLNDAAQKVDVLFYDLTTVYFETNTQDELRDFGFSKDGKGQHVQIMLAIIVTKEGLPIDYLEFPGNSFEGHTLIPVITKLSKKYNIEKTVLVADAGLMNKINLQELTELNISYVISAKIKNTTEDLKEQIFAKDTYSILHDNNNDTITSKVINLDSGDSLLCFHSSKRARKDIIDREKTLEKITKYISGGLKKKLTGPLKKPYISIKKGSGIEINAEKLQEEAKYDGFFGIQTNLSDPDAAEILNTYRGLWQVEQTFRITKSTLQIRPVYHYAPRRIRSHFAICYIALSLIRFTDFTLSCRSAKIPTDNLIMLLHNMRAIEITHQSGCIFKIIEDPPEEMHKIYRTLKIKWPKKFQPLQ